MYPYDVQRVFTGSRNFNLWHFCFCHAQPSRSDNSVGYFFGIPCNRSRPTRRDLLRICDQRLLAFGGWSSHRGCDNVFRFRHTDCTPPLCLHGCSYIRAVWVLSLGGLVLGALVPSAIPRVIVMMPITLALTGTMGLLPGSRGHTGLLMTGAMMTLVPTYAFLTANLPTIIELGTIDILYGERFTYGAYFIQNAPINAVRFAVLLMLLLTYGRTVVSTNSEQEGTELTEPLTSGQVRLSWLLILAIFFWATDTWHGIAPAWITLAAALVLLLPSAGIFSPQAMKTEIDFSIAFLIAAVFCISAVITDIGLGAKIAKFIVPALALGQGNSFWDFTAVTAFSTVLSHLTIAPATPVVLAPLVGSMSDATGWSINAVAMAHNVGFSTTALPYQSPPLLIGIAIARIPVGALTRLCLVSALVTSVVGIPLTWAWWVWIGFI